MQHPGIVAAAIAGAGIGGVAGFMKSGEYAEEHGSSEWQQVTSSVSGILPGAAKGAMIGGIPAGTVAALKYVLGK